MQRLITLNVSRKNCIDCHFSLHLHLHLWCWRPLIFTTPSISFNDPHSSIQGISYCHPLSDWWWFEEFNTLTSIDNKVVYCLYIYFYNHWPQFCFGCLDCIVSLVSSNDQLLIRLWARMNFVNAIELFSKVNNCNKIFGVKWWW